MNLTWIENTLIFALNSYVDKKLKYHRPIGALDVSHFLLHSNASVVWTLHSLQRKICVH